MIAKNLTTGMIRNILSLEDGSYRMEQLPPGNYEVHAEAESLKRSSLKELILKDDSRVELPIYMEAGGADSLTNIEKLPIIDLRPSITLEPIFTAGSVGVKRVELKGNSQVADIRLRAPVTGFSSFVATIGTVDGKTVYSRRFRKNAIVNGIVALSVRSKLLNTGDYVIRLRGLSAKGRLEPLTEFYFHVQKSE